MSKLCIVIVFIIYKIIKWFILQNKWGYPTAKVEKRYCCIFQSPTVDPSSPQQQEAALTIQTNVRKHKAEQEVEAMRQEDAAVKIQAGIRGYQDRQKVAEMKYVSFLNRFVMLYLKFEGKLIPSVDWIPSVVLFVIYISHFLLRRCPS